MIPHFESAPGVEFRKGKLNVYNGVGGAQDTDVALLREELGLSEQDVVATAVGAADIACERVKQLSGVSAFVINCRIE